jgi:hypothetical protein
MAIRIVRNEQGNCINFYGSSNPTYWNACLSGEVDSTDTNSINIINDIITSETGVTQYEFFRVPYTDFVDAEGNGFLSPQEAAGYITEKANVTGLGGGGTDLTDQVVCFKLDDTSTSIMLDNGHSYGVNTIKAINTGDGLITIQSDLGDIIHFTKLDHTRVCDGDGTLIGGGLNDVINYLNELFTVGAFESVVISDPYSTMVADVDGEDTSVTYIGYGLDPLGNDIYGSTSSNSQNGLLSTETIDQAGEYFTFDIRNEGTIGFGLVHTQDSYDAGLYSGSATYADPTRFGIDNSAHYGFQFSHWFHPTPNGSWTNYGANTSYSMRSGWSNFNGSDEQNDWLNGNPIKVRVGIDENGYISIDTLRDGSVWVAHSRTSYPVPQGSEYRLGIKTNHTGARVFSLPKVHLLEPEAPTMYFRYIESPDGVFQYPLFASTEEAQYYDEQAGGSGTYHSHVFADEPTNTTWYMPDTNAVHNGTSAPAADGTLGQMAPYTEITSLTNADQIPPAFSSGGVSTLFVDELSSVNYQTQPVDTAYTTTFSGLPSGLISNGGDINGTAPEVTGDNVANPSDTYTITVTRTNSYGSSTGTLSIIVANLTAPIVTPISGVSDEGGTALIDSDTMDDGSVVSIDNVINVGNRFTFDKEWLDNYVLPKITSGSGAKAVYIGFPKSNANWSSVGVADFLLGYQFYSDDTSRAQNNWRLRVLVDGVIHYNVGVGGQTSGLYDYALINDGADISIGSLVASQGLNISTYVYNFSGVDANWKYTGGLTGVSSSTRDIVIATNGTDMDLDLQYFNEYTEPVAPTNQTSWTKALDFSGGSEYAKQVSNYSFANPISMGFTGTTVPAHSTDSSKTSNYTYSRPWATAVVFKSDGNNSNQHIWNYGEGAGSTDDNIYLRTDQFGALYFGWGRQGALNEYLISTNIGSSAWYGVYVGYKGARYSASDATAANLASQFDIKLMFYSGGSWIFNPNPTYGGAGTWITTGGRMDRSIGGHLTIGGRGANRNFHGKVASMVVTTLVADRYLPTTNEIEKMITDPIKWLNNFKVGKEYRIPTYQYPQTGSNSFAMNGTNEDTSTQVWLMGDGTYDSYANGMRNQVKPGSQNYTKLQLNSMVSNDIQNVNISGLT